MAAGALYSASLFLPHLCSSTHRTPQPIHYLCFNPPSITLSTARLRFSASPVLAPRLPRRVFQVHCLVSDDSVTAPEPDNSEAAVSVDLNLPRRSLLVQFTCNLCGERTERLVNRLAYERGAVFVQCAGCLRHHKLVDNLGLITEYDFRKKIDMDSDIDQV